MHQGATVSRRGRKRPPVPEVRSPTLRRRELGALLRARRLDQGLTVEQVAAQLLCSPSKVSRMETGQRGATQRDIRDLCDFYGITDPAERELLVTLAKEGKQQGWWQTYELPHATFVWLEQEATSMKVYHSAVIPGLLQTGDYVRALHDASTPDVDPGVIEQRIEERMRRQELLDRDQPPRIEIVLDEAALHRPIGGPAIMRRQLDRVLESVGRPSLDLQILPFEIGAHPALESDFIILEFADQSLNVVFVEGLIGPVYLERAHDVQRYLQVFERLRVMAASPQDSADLIIKIRDTYVVG